MLVLSLLLVSTFLHEVAESLGKRSIQHKEETVFNIAFLGAFWGLILMVGTVVFFNAPIKVSPESIPLLGMRLIGEIALGWIAAKMLVKADLSTIGFLRILTIPLILAVDLILGYHLSIVQIIGIFLMIVALYLAFHHNPKGKRGAGWVLAGAFLAVLTASLFKYNITHYNSVAAEQIIILSAMVTFFFVTSYSKKKSPLKLLIRPVSGAQSFAQGFSMTILSFAFALAPASIIIALNRTLSLWWTIILGRKYFHETSLPRKLQASCILAVGLFMVISPLIII